MSSWSLLATQIGKPSRVASAREATEMQTKRNVAASPEAAREAAAAAAPKAAERTHRSSREQQNKQVKSAGTTDTVVAAAVLEAKRRLRKKRKHFLQQQNMLQHPHLATRDELLRRRDARLMAFVRQQLMLPVDTVAGEDASALNMQQKSILRPRSVVLLTEKQRQALLQSSNEEGSSRQLKQGPEQDSERQQQEQAACSGKKTSRGCGEVATLPLALLQEEVQQQQEHSCRGTPLILSARSPGAAAAAAAAAVLMLPAHPSFPCSSSSTPPLPVEHHHQLVQLQQEKSCSEAASGAVATEPLAAATAAEFPLSPIQVASAVTTPRSCNDSFPPNPMVVAGPTRQPAAACTPAAAAAARTGQRLEAVKQCANRVREALRLEGKISALLTHTEHSGRRSSSGSRSSSKEKLFDGLEETFATPRPVTPRNGSMEIPFQMQRGNAGSPADREKVITPPRVSTGCGEMPFPPIKQQLHRMQQPQDQRQHQPQVLSRCEDGSCSDSARVPFGPTGQRASGLKIRSLQCTPRAANGCSSSRSSRGTQLINAGVNEVEAAVNTESAASAAAERAEAAEKAAKTILNKQQDRVIVRLSLGSLKCSPPAEGACAASAETLDALRQEDIQRKQLQKLPSQQQQTEPRRRNSFVQSLKARADAYRDQKQQQHPDGVPRTPKGTIFRTAISQGSGSSASIRLVSSTSSSNMLATSAVHWPHKVLAKLPSEVDPQRSSSSSTEQRHGDARELFARDKHCLNQDEEGDEREIELLLTEEAQSSFNDWGRSPLQ
ncbi:hypothetical protein EPH_0000850 [Eimeria praecox]|uniref:Uncharacterized protein n=1 Tax=Eimeria praecox TaxID=51316 RepID=U6G0Q3_9EIME|nr:hypothetical protein EPH_0000850 [Eimeria praecox]